jgi:hypothetical protein
MKNPEESNLDTFFRTFAVAVLVVSLILAGRNAQENSEKHPGIPIHSIKNHNLQIGNA